MSDPLVVGVDVELLLVQFLRAQLDGARVATELPSNVGTVVPAVQVTVIGPGGAIRRTLNRATVDIDCFEVDRDSARKFAHRCQAVLEAHLPGTADDRGRVTAVRTVLGPQWRPWDNTTLRRFGITVEVITHSQPTS